jgi:hypothetical protein
MRQPAAFAFPARPPDEPRALPLRPRRAHVDLTEIYAAVTAAVAEATRPRGLGLEEVAHWCAEVGGVDPRLELAALRHALEIIALDALRADVMASLRARMAAAGDLLPVLIARGGVPRVLATLGLDDVEPPEGAITVLLPPRIARFYWQRLRAYVAWCAACAISR